MLKQFYSRIIAVLLAIAILGLSITKHYGATWDEWVEDAMVEWNIDYITERKPIPNDSQYYGFIYNYVAQFVFDPRTSLQEIFGKERKFADTEPGRMAELKKRLEVKHIFTFIFSLLTYLAVAGIVGILAGWDFAWLGAFMLVFFPRFWGHSFFNPKDIPFATVFTVSTVLGAYLINYYTNYRKNNNKIGLNKITFYSLGYGSLLGLLTGIRIGGFVTLFFLIIAHCLTQPQKILENLLRFSKFYLVMILGWMLTTILLYPSAWFHPSGPVAWFFETINYFSKNHIFNNSILFNGQSIPARSMPWTYIVQNFLMSIPAVFLFFLFLGIGLLLYHYKSLTYLQRASAILVISQTFILPIMAMFSKASLSDGMRHFLFVMPSTCAIATFAIVEVYKKLKAKTLRLIFTSFMVVCLLAIAMDMISLHPYEYVYFNRLSGGLARANGQQEIEYYGLSIREASEWINAHAAPNSKVVTSGPSFVYKLFIDPQKNLTLVHLDNFKEGAEPNPDYYIGLHRYGYETVFSSCPVVYQVKRQDVPFNSIKKC